MSDSTLDALTIQRACIAKYVEECHELFVVNGPPQTMTADEVRATIRSALALVAEKIREGAG